MLWATAPGREEAEWYRRRLGEYRWTLGVSCKGGGSEGSGNARLTEFAMSMLDTSTGLLKSLPEKPALSRAGSEAEILGGQQRHGSLVQSYSYGSFFSGRGLGIGAARDGSVGRYGVDRDADTDAGLAMESGLASPSTSVSDSSEESVSAYEAFHAP